MFDVSRGSQQATVLPYLRDLARRRTMRTPVMSATPTPDYRSPPQEPVARATSARARANEPAGHATSAHAQAKRPAERSDSSSSPPASA
ncbi:hypothetical protein TRAPUB_12529, partial [Trametes pubescens]